MAPLFEHDPDGDRNPYDHAPWGRHPFTPRSDERMRVGARATGPCDAAEVEWQCGDEHGRIVLRRDEDAWVGELGPFPESASYRFVATGGPNTGTASEWFGVPVVHWEPVGFCTVDAIDGHILVGTPTAQLALKPGPPGSASWSLGAAAAPRAGSSRARIDDWTVELETGGGVAVSFGPNRSVLRVASGKTDDAIVSWRLTWSLQPDERIFGTGERFDTLDQRGKSPDIRVFEQYKAQGSRSYFPLPWLLSTAGYGFAIDGAGRVSYDLGVSHSDEASATIPGASASGRWYFGEPHRLLMAYATDHGLPGAVPVWAFGPWMSGNEWDSAPRVRQVVERTLAEGIPATVLVIEAWSDEATFYLFNDADHDPVPGADPVPAGSIRHGGRWPDPRTLVEWLHDQGIRVLLWQIPVLKDSDDSDQHARDVAHAEAAGLCVATGGGGSYRNRGWWFPGSRIIDFTKASARSWWFGKRSYLIDDIGVDGFKTDGGEHLWGRDVVTADGSLGDEAANSYPSEYLGGYHEFLRGRGHERPLTFSRAGFTGCQAFPAHWAGDEDSTWEAYRASLTAGLSAGTSGVAFWSWDLAGFSGELPSAELYKRAAAMAAFCPIMQYHSEHNEHRTPLADRTPWNVADHHDDPDVTAIYSFYARWRMNLIPYLFGLGEEASRTGLPMMRAMAIEFPTDPVSCAIDDQFLLGSDLLVAPVLEPGVDARRTYVPAGDWRDLWTGVPIPSGWTMAPAPIDTIPAFVRGGTCVPLWMPAGAGPAELPVLGSSVALPTETSGRQVLLVTPGSGTSTLTDPVTADPWSVTLESGIDVLAIDIHDATRPGFLWLRGASDSETLVPFPAGDSRFDLPVAGHGH